MKYAPQIGYEAYCKSCGGKAFNGDPLPTWEDLPDVIKRHWRAAAETIRVYVITEEWK